ncbi:MAG: hypothetical protein FJ291_26025, partial [Planctomycetes bacterium]|nr:hypothetical protein [Planctomycetota bacterium]
MTKAAVAFVLCASGALGGSPEYLFGNPRGQAGFAIWVASARAGLLFTDAEPLDVRVRAAGADGATTVEYSARESGGPWQTRGKAVIEKGAGEARLPLELPGRGLYQLDLAATCGTATSKAQTWLAVVFAPDKPDPASPWGIFYTPHVWFNKDDPDGPRNAAQSHRLLGAAWSRLNFWAHSFGKVTVADGPKPAVTADWSLWKSYARALREEGISIFGEIAQCPRELSSRPDETAAVGDAGPVWCRVKPADYALWNQLMEKLAAAFRDEIGVWEVWNEPNLPNRYWTGTVEDFAEHVKHTSQALRRGNPHARIAVGGFVDGHAFADRLLQLGIGKHMDILSVHYTDERPGSLAQWRALLKKHGLDVPIWNSEERSEVPLRNLAGGVERSFKFIHVLIGYPEYRPLVRKDWTVLPAGIAFSVGAHCIGAGKFAGSDRGVPGVEVFLFRRGEEMVAALQGGAARPKLFAKAQGSATLAIEPLEPGKLPVATDIWGRSRPLNLEDGRATIPLRGELLFINGARQIKAEKGAATQAGGEALVFEAEAGRCSTGWGRNPKAGYSDGRLLELWTDREPDAQGYWAEVAFRIPADGPYELLVAGNALSRLKPPRSLSTLAWSIDGGKEQLVDAPVPMLHDVPGAPEGLSVLA